MKKFLYAFLLIMIVALSGCNANDQAKEEPAKTAEETVTVILSKDKGAEEIGTKEVDYQEGDTVMDVMERNYEIETAFEGKFINGIDGIVPKEGEAYAWMYSVNGEDATVSATEYELKPGDEIHFDYQSWK
jgi:hypothetical protein